MLWTLALTASAGPCVVGYQGSGATAGTTSIAFINGKRLAETEARHADAERRSPKPTPLHGAVVLTYERHPIQLANPDNQVVVLESGGAVIARREAETPDPELPAGMSARWGQIVVLLPDETVFPVTVHAADRTLGHRCSWSISWEGHVELL